MFDDESNTTYLDILVEAYERSEDNLIALDDSRFAEIYLEDKPRRKALKTAKGEPQ